MYRTSSTHSQHAPPTLFARALDSYVANLAQYRAALWFVMMMVFGLSCFFAPKLLQNTSQSFQPPSTSRASTDRKQVEQLFPRMEKTSDLSLYITRHGESVLSPQLANFSVAFCEALENHNETNLLLNCGGYYSYEEVQHGSGSGFLNVAHDASFIAITLSADCTSKPATKFADWISDEVISSLQATYDCVDYDMTLMGCSAFLRVMKDNSREDVERVGLFVTPIALVAVAVTLWSIRLMLVAVMVLLVSGTVSFSLVYFASFSMAIFASAPSLMTSMLVSVSLSYSLLLLDRYRAEMNEQLQLNGIFCTRNAIKKTLKTAGVTVLASGLALIVCFLGLCFFRIDILKTFGLACAVVMVCVVVFNVILVPLSLLSLEDFFEHAITITAAKCNNQPTSSLSSVTISPRHETHRDSADIQGSDFPRERQRSERSADDSNFSAPPQQCFDRIENDRSIHQQGKSITLTKHHLGNDSFPRSLHHAAPAQEEAQEEDNSSFSEASASEIAMIEAKWFKVAMFVSSIPVNIIVLIMLCGVVAPFAPKAFSYTTTDENILYLPKGSCVADAYDEMGKNFGYGEIFSYQVMMFPKNVSRRILDDTDDFELWDLTHEAISGLVHYVKGFDTKFKDFTGASQAGMAPPIGPDSMFNCLNKSHAQGVTCGEFLRNSQIIQDEICRGNVMLACAFMNNQDDPSESNAMWFRFTPQFAPMSSTGRLWLKHARRYADAFSVEHPLNLVFVGTPADALDSMSSINDDFLPMVVAITGVLFIGVILMFKSIFIPLVCAVTKAASVLFVYGFATLTYEDCALDGTGFMGFECTHAVVYMIPLMSFAIVVGIGLLFDLCVVMRIIESLEDDNMSTPEAICQGVAKSASVVSAMGVVMVLGFSGLFLSRTPFMHQLSFYMVCYLGIITKQPNTK